MFNSNIPYTLVFFCHIALGIKLKQYWIIVKVVIIFFFNQ